MSFAQQEALLFDLLFDHQLREDFCTAPETVLETYQLTENERQDFACVRSDALQLDAEMRADLMLTHLCRVYPLSFSLLSSLLEDLKCLHQLIDKQHMQHPPAERPAAFGVRLRDSLAISAFESEQEQALVTAILEAELGMAWTASSLKQRVLNGETLPVATEVAEDWLGRPLQLADYVSAALLPAAYDELKTSLCAVEDAALWRHLNRQPLSTEIRQRVLSGQQPRLLMAQARVTRYSACEPVIEHQTLQLSDGFAPLLQHINGTNSVSQILAELKKLGAPEPILQGVHSGFEQLLGQGMLVAC